MAELGEEVDGGDKNKAEVKGRGMGGATTPNSAETVGDLLTCSCGFHDFDVLGLSGAVYPTSSKVVSPTPGQCLFNV